MPLHKEKLFSPAAKYTTLTKIFSGRLARGFASILTSELKSHEHLMAPYPMQSRFLARLREAATKSGQHEYITFWSGQSAPLISHHETETLFNALVADTNKLYL
jgi:nitronate monooxygenase